VAEEIRMPRSGIWHLRSTKDQRWNRSGQYSSLLGDPPYATPTEAQQAIDELRASLGEGPPDDLRWVSIPYPTPKLKRLFDVNVFAATEKHGTFHFLTSESGLSSLNLNLKEGEVSFGKPGQPPSYRLPAQFLGLLAAEQSYWQWGWVSEERGSMNPEVLAQVKTVREYGNQHEIPELTYAELALGQENDRPWFNADYLAVVASHICQADFFISGPDPDAPGLTMYWLVKAPGLLPKPPSESQRIALVIQEAMSRWADALRGSKGRQLVQAYADQKNCRVAEVGERRLRIDTPSGEHCFVDFEESGGIYGIELPAKEEAQPAKRSWMSRLFGRK
jgi:hypothetical protein